MKDISYKSGQISLCIVISALSKELWKKLTDLVVYRRNSRPMSTHKTFFFLNSDHGEISRTSHNGKTII